MNSFDGLRMGDRLVHLRLNIKGVVKGQKPGLVYLVFEDDSRSWSQRPEDWRLEIPTTLPKYTKDQIVRMFSRAT